MKLHKRILAFGTAMVLTVGLSSSALAAEDEAPADAPEGISVQLDGKDITFTDALPEAMDGRTFLPFRAVFEALGAKVDYDAETNAVIAERDGATVRMVLGAKEATVEQNGVTSKVLMDVAAYAKNDRTYVPVRFAAQALGCAVGWDQDDQTVILVDAGKLVDGVVAEYEYTYLEKFADYYAKFMKDGWAVKGSFDGEMAFMAVPITVNGTMDGLMKDAAQMQMTMNMKMDMEQFIKSLMAMQQQTMSAEDEAMLKALKESGIDMEMRGDMAAGLMYMTMSDKSGMMEAAGMDKDTWYSMDLNSAFQGTGVTFQDLMDMSKLLDMKAVVAASASGVALTDKDTAVADVTSYLNKVAGAAADSAFVKEGNDYTAELLNATVGDTATGMLLTFTMKNNKIVGYSIGMNVTSTTTADDGTASKIEMNMSMGMDEKNHAQAEVMMNMMEMLTMDLTMEMDYTTSTKTPAVEPPAGATVVPMENMVTASGAAQAVPQPEPSPAA